MKREFRQPGRPLSFDQALDCLRAHGFEISTFAGRQGGVLAGKCGAGAVLVAAGDPAVAIAEGPGVLIRGELARLVDRGYQKFIETSRCELPATAGQLHAVHTFGEELKQLTGAASLFNESLGTTSDLYLYDRLRGREPSDEEEANRH